MPCKGSERACLDCIWKPRENQIWKSERTSELGKCAAHKYGETRKWQVCHRWWYGPRHRRRIELFSKITFILEQSEWSIAKDVGPFSRKIQCKTLTNVLWFGECLCLQHWKHLYSWERITQTIHIPSTIQEKSHFEANVRDIWTVDIATIGWDFWSVTNQLGRLFMEIIISGQWWRSHQSLACKGLCILRFCVMSWKDESEPNIKYCLGTTVGLVQRFITIQNFGHNWRRTDGIQVECVPGFTALQLVQEVQQFMNKKGEPEHFQGRIIFMSMFNDIIWWTKDNERECIANVTLVTLFAKRFPAGRWSFLGLGSETKWYSTYNERPGGEWDRVAELMMIKFGESWHPVFRATSPLSPGNDQKQRRWKIIYTLPCRWGYDWNCFSHNYFCRSAQYLRSSLRFVWWIRYLSSKNGETRAGRTIWSSVRASKIIDNDTYTFDWDSCTRKSITEAQGTSGKAIATRSSDKDLCWCRILVNSWSRTILHDKTHWRVLTTCSASILYHEMKIQLKRKVGFRETPKLAPQWKSQPVTYKVNTEWKSELGLWTKTSLIRGSEFLTAWTNWPQTWSTRSTTTTSRRLLHRRRKHLRLQADPWLKQIQEDLPLLANLQRLHIFLKENGLTRIRSSIRSSVPSGKKDKHSSWTRRITSRRR